jgi:transcriptional regulator with XRE-family HTH domain
MGGKEELRTPHASGTLDGRSAGPVVPRLALGARLRGLREELGISREVAGESIRASRSKISRLEAGRHAFKLRDVADLLTLYGVTDEAERATLLTLAEQANAPAWWQYFNDVVPVWMQACLGAEQAASVIRCFESNAFPSCCRPPTMRVPPSGSPTRALPRRRQSGGSCCG